MALDPDDLRYVQALARQGSLLAASRALEVDKATVIRRVDALEDALGTQVVTRSPKGWALTPAGLEAVAAADRVQAVLEELQSSLRSEPGGVVRLTVPGWLARMHYIPAMSSFLAQYPKVDLRIITSNAVLDLGKREADIGLRNVRPTQARFVCKRVGVLGCAVYAARTYVERRGAPSGPDDLSRHHLVGYEGKLVHPDEHAFLMNSGAPVAFRVTDTLALIDALRAGLGIGSVPCAVGDSEPSLVRLDLPVSQDDIFLVYPDDLRAAPRVRAVVEWAAQVWQASADVLAGHRS